MKPRICVLDEDERSRLHRQAIRILEEAGVCFPSEMALDALTAAGALVDREEGRVRISEAMVSKALSLCPKKVFFGARDPGQAFTLPGGPSAWNLDGCGVFTFDLAAGKRRTALLSDVEAAAKVFDAIGPGTLAWPPVSPDDVPAGPRSLVSTAAMYRNTSKHVMDEVKTREEVPYVMALAAVLAGGPDQVKARAMYSATYCTVSPLTHDRSMLEATMDLSRFHAPILVYPTPASGTTGPASLFSNVALAVAEALSTIVLLQSHTPGCPLIMGAAMGAVDGRTGAFSYGMAETALQLMAMGEMCGWYQMPSFIAGGTTDAMMPGIQATFEKMLTAIPLVLEGVGMINGMGLLECGMTLSLEQMVLDGQMALALKGFSPQEGPEERASGQLWLGQGGADPLQQAHRAVEEILAQDQRLPMDGTMEKALDEVLAEGRAKLGRPGD